MTAFDEATAVIPDGDGCYRVRPDERFAIFLPDGATGAVNGGVLMATVLRAVLEVWDSAGRLAAQSRQIARLGRGA